MIPHNILSKRSLLNFKRTMLGILESLGNSFVSIFIVCLAFGGRKERNSRAVFALGENGLKTVETSVMNLVIILNWVAAGLIPSVNFVNWHDWNVIYQVRLYNQDRESVSELIAVDDVVANSPKEARELNSASSV